MRWVTPRHDHRNEGAATIATDHGPSIKDDEQYEALRKDGASKEKAARIANTDRHTAAERGGESPSSSMRCETTEPQSLKRKATQP